MTDIIGASTKELRELGVQKYVEEYNAQTELKDQLVSLLTKITDNVSSPDTPKIIAQALREAKIVEHPSNYALDRIVEYTNGSHMITSVDEFLRLFDALQANSFTSAESTFNSSGDNYFFALEMSVAPTESDIQARALTQKILKREGAKKNPVEPMLRKIIVMENQSPAYLFVLDHSTRFREPNTLTVVQLRRDYDEPIDYVKILSNLAVNKEISECGIAHKLSSLQHACRVIATFDINKINCSHVIIPSALKNALLGLHSGAVTIEEM
tara:strand:+ start:246 stop:1052 length:807 start_codon:yes stop_codon:yes gene_type:complete